jgi:hypothetical protein
LLTILKENGWLLNATPFLSRKNCQDAKYFSGSGAKMRYLSNIQNIIRYLSKLLFDLAIESMNNDRIQSSLTPYKSEQKLEQFCLSR